MEIHASLGAFWDLDLNFEKKAELMVSVYTDAGYPQQIFGRPSISGVEALLGGAGISATSCFQRCVRAQRQRA